MILSRKSSTELNSRHQLYMYIQHISGVSSDRQAIFSAHNSRVVSIRTEDQGWSNGFTPKLYRNNFSNCNRPSARSVKPSEFISDIK